MAVNNNDKTEHNFSKNKIPDNNQYADIEIEDDFAQYTFSEDSEIFKNDDLNEDKCILDNSRYETD